MSNESYFRRVQESSPTQFFCDGPVLALLQRAIGWGAVGATSNPPRANLAVQDDLEYWCPRVKEMIKAHPELPDEDIADLLNQAVVKRTAEVLLPIYEQTKGQKGIHAIQGDPQKYTDLEVLISSAKRYSKISPNVAVKIPVHREGLEAIEELTAAGIKLIATTGYSVAHCIAAAEAHARGLSRAKNPEQVSRFIVTIVTGRLDAHFSDRIAEDNLSLPQEFVDKAGMAVTKKIYRLFKERNLPSMLLAAGGRQPHHFTDYVGGQMAVTVGPPLQEKIIEANPPVVSRIDDFPSDGEIEELRQKLPDFRQAYDDDGLSVDQMRDFSPCMKLEQYFLEGFDKFLQFIRSARDH